MSDKFSGVIERLFVKFNEKTKKNSISIINNGNFYGCGLYEGKTVEVDGKVLQEGWNVEFEYSGKFKNIDMNTFKIVSNEVPKEIKKTKNDKDIGIRLGNATTVASHFTNTHIDLVDLAVQIVPMVDELRERLAKKHTDMDTYALSARVGQCVIMSAQFTKNKDKFIEVAEELFEELCFAEQELKSPKEIKNKEEHKSNNTTQSPMNVAPPVYSEQHIDWDDSIPFALIGLQYPQILMCM